MVGVYANEMLKPVRILKHGRKARILLKYGLEIIATIRLNPLAIKETDIFEFLIF